MDVVINGKKTETSCCYLQELVAGQQGQTLLYNGYQTEENLPLQAGDQIVILPRGVMPDRDSWESMLAARHTPPVHERIRQGAVAIAGLGGLGSHIAVMLARAGIGKLLLVDFDTVEISNLNRQHYTVRHLGMPKTEALAMQLQEINPFVQITTRQVTVCAENAVSLFADWPLVCEAFDNPAAKAMLVNTLLADGQKQIVAASGMAGYGSANQIQTVRKIKGLYLCGDEKSEAAVGQSLMAPRVQICAGHQANMVLRLLLGLTAP